MGTNRHVLLSVIIQKYEHQFCSGGCAIKKTIETGEGQTVWMKSVGVNEEGIEVSTFNFEWTIKLKS